MSPTPGSKKKDPVVAAEDESQPATPVNGSSNGKKVSASTAKRDEVVVDVPEPSGSKESTDSQGDSPTPSVSSPSSSSSSNDTVTDLKTDDLKAKVDDAPAASSDWTTPSEPGGSVFAGRTDAPPPKPAFGVREVVGPKPAEAPMPSAAGGFMGGPAPAEHLTPDSARGGKPVPGGRSPRKAHLQVSRFEPWSVMKFSFVMSLVCFIVLMVAVVVLYMILSGLGVFDAISSTINELTQEQGATKTSGFDAASWFSFTRIFAYTALVGALNVLLITALATVWSVIYNIAADFVGGVEVTLKEAE